MQQLVTKRRRLFFDIETSPNVGTFWQSGYKLRVSWENIIRERQIICICYKWEDEKQVHSLTWDKKQSDKKMLVDFIKIANTADELVGHNGDKFDLPWIITRCLFHRIEVFPRYITADTLQVARRKLKFNSNQLNYIGQFLGVGKKMKTDYNLWLDVMFKKDEKKLARMVKYCKGDVVLLEKVYRVLRSQIPDKTHFGVVFGEDRGSCTECGDAKNLVRKSLRRTATGVLKIQYRCTTCGHHHTKTETAKNKPLP